MLHEDIDDRSSHSPGGSTVSVNDDVDEDEFDDDGGDDDEGEDEDEDHDDFDDNPDGGYGPRIGAALSADSGDSVIGNEEGHLIENGDDVGFINPEDANVLDDDASQAEYRQNLLIEPGYTDFAGGDYEEADAEEVDMDVERNSHDDVDGRNTL